MSKTLGLTLLENYTKPLPEKIPIHIIIKCHFSEKFLWQLYDVMRQKHLYALYVAFDSVVALAHVLARFELVVGQGF